MATARSRACVRTNDDVERSGGMGNVQALLLSPHGSDTAGSQIGKGTDEGDTDQTPKLWDAPRVRFGDVGRTATYSEVFFDLVYVLVLQQMFAHITMSTSDLLTFVWYWVITWNSWNGISFYCTRFDTDDTFARLTVVAAMLGVVGMSIGVNRRAFDPTDSLFVLSYAFVRAVLVANYIRGYVCLASTRTVTGWFIVGFGLAVPLWILSALTSGALSTAAWVFALFGCYATPFLMLPVMVPFHPEHMAERNGCFTVLISAGLVFNFHGFVFRGSFTAHRIGCVVLGLVLPYLFNLLYSTQEGPRMKGFMDSAWRKLRAYTWLYSHMLLSLAVTTMSIAVGYVDCMECATMPSASGADVAPHHALLVFYWGAVLVHVLLAVQHLLGTNENMVSEVRASVRLASAALLLFLAYALRPHVSCFGNLSVITAVFAVEALIDVSPAIVRRIEVSKGCTVDTDDTGSTLSYGAVDTL